eukprot:Rmarinus@m.16522
MALRSMRRARVIVFNESVYFDQSSLLKFAERDASHPRLSDLILLFHALHFAYDMKYPSEQESFVSAFYIFLEHHVFGMRTVASNDVVLRDIRHVVSMLNTAKKKLRQHAPEDEESDKEPAPCAPAPGGPTGSAKKRPRRSSTVLDESLMEDSASVTHHRRAMKLVYPTIKALQAFPMTLCLMMTTLRNWKTIDTSLMISPFFFLICILCVILHTCTS